MNVNLENPNIRLPNKNDRSLRNPFTFAWFILKLAIFAIIMLAGAILGAIVAFYVTLYSCVLIDSIQDNGGGDGFVTIGWLFCIITVPLGFVFGGFVFLWLTGLVISLWQHQTASSPVEKNQRAG